MRVLTNQIIEHYDITQFPQKKGVKGTQKMAGVKKFHLLRL